MDLFASLIASNLNLSKSKIIKVLTLFDEGATIPFIARYRKEMTGGFDEVNLSDIQSAYKKLKEIEQRKATILKSIKEQDKLNPDLENKINNCWDLQLLEDIYLPYKQKRKTRAEAARKKGLEPLAKIIMSQRNPFPFREAENYVRGEVKNKEEALAGAKDIIAEWVNENAISRNNIRSLFSRQALLSSKLVKKYKTEAEKYKDYFDFEAPLKKCPSHRVLAIRRAEKQGYLKVKISIDKDHAQEALERIFIKADNESSDLVKEAITDSYKRLLHPAIETEFQNKSKEKADAEAINVFANNVKQLLMAPPAGSKITLGIDPGFRTGCKLVVLDAQGNLKKHSTIYPHPPQSQWDKSLAEIQTLISNHDVRLVAVGNGTAGRETLSLAKQAAKDIPGIQVFSVNESGASIYSASETAREEFGELDLTVRGTVSIARRLMDPLAELVKIDPKSIGVGQYQHDVHQERLKESLDNVVSFTVNQVGVNLNTASHHLLSYVSGIGPKLAKNIVSYRKEIASFAERKELKKVKGLGSKAYEQSAGFLRIPDADNILDRTAVHPESYSIVKKMAQSIGKPVKELVGDDTSLNTVKLSEFVTDTIGLPTLKDIINELKKPGLDPRGAAEQFSFAEQIKTIDDLSVGIVVPGIVSNLTKFGAFIDIGIKENGLVHISQIVDKFIKDPAEVLHLDQKVKVEIISIDKDRKRIALKIKGVPQK